MNNKPKFEGREVDNASPELMREELEKYIQHMLGHDPSRLEFALMVTGHGEANGGTHVCSMIGGPPQTLARIIIELMDDLIKRDPAFATFFLLNIMQRASGAEGVNIEVMGMSEPDLDNAGGPEAKTQVKEILSKIMGGSTPPGSIH